MIGDITDIKRMLADRALSVAEYLLPHGRKDGNEWRAGSVSGEAGQSLGVHLVGAKAGIWSDFASGNDRGDLLDLWAKSKNVSLAEALAEAREWLGVERPSNYQIAKKTYQRPPKPICAAPRGRVMDYLREERGISSEVLAKYKIGEDGEDIIFPFLLPDGELALAKRRRAHDGAKPVPTAAGCEPILFGWQAIDSDARELIITEGEIDALSWATYGYSALSVPFGGGGGAKQQWIENDFERMDRFEKIYISTDMDQQGDEAAEEIADRLGRHRCLRVKLPHKDANQCLINGLSVEDMRSCLDNATALDPEGLKRPSAFVEDVQELFWPTPGQKRIGVVTPYKKLGDKLIFRPAELTLWSGDSGAGKSQILSDCIVDWVDQGARTCLCSLEMQAKQSLRRMVKQAIGVDRPTPQAIDKSLYWLDRGLLLYDRVGKRGVDDVLPVFDFARSKYGCDNFVIDSLMRLGIAQDDYNGQEGAVYKLVTWALERRVHVHLVAHSRKSKEGGVPKTADVKGAMEIGANAFNIITVWRNKKLEEQIRAAKTEEEATKLREQPTVVFNIDKQRNGDFEGTIGLWFNQENYQYQSSHDRSDWARNYIRHASELMEAAE